MKTFIMQNGEETEGMTVYTSRYFNPLLKTWDGVKVGITLGVPKFPVGYDVSYLVELAPDRAMMHMEKEKFREAYRAKMNRLGIVEVRKMVYDTARRQLISQGKEVGEVIEVALLCYEDVRIPEDWCHRLMLAEWWQEQLGEVVKELPNPTEPGGKKKAPSTVQKARDRGQLELFNFDAM